MTHFLDNETVYFGEMTKEMGSAIILVPLIAILQHIAIVKAFGKFSIHCGCIYIESLGLRFMLMCKF